MNRQKRRLKDLKGISRNFKTIPRIRKKYMLCSPKCAAVSGGGRWDSKSTSMRICSIVASMRIGPTPSGVTDVSYIRTKQGVLYLSMIRDLYDNSIAAYKAGTEQTVNPVPGPPGPP